MPLTSIVLEYTSDPVSDSTPTWTTVSNDEFKSIRYWAGSTKEGEAFNPGGAQIVLYNKNRKWEPLFGSNVIDTHQRFRLTLNGTVEGTWFITSLAIEYPGNTEYSEVVATCGDGSETLALDNLPTLDPPEATGYAEVVGSEGSLWGYWRLGEPAGTRAKPNIVKGRRRVGTKSVYVVRKFKARRGTNYSTVAEVGAVAGPAGAYRNKPTLGQPGLVVGDSDTCVRFDSANSHWVRVAFEDDELKTDPLTLEAIVKPISGAGANRYIIGGPSIAGSPAFFLQHTAAEFFSFGVTDNLGNTQTITGGTTIITDTPYHVAGTYDGLTLRIYVNGVEDATAVTTPGRGIGSWATNALGIGAFPTPAQHFDGYIDEVAIYEEALSAERIAAHADAAFNRGYPQQTAGTRIAAIMDSPLWSEASIQTTGRDVLPMMQSGQPKMEVIEEVARSEGQRPMVYFKANGDPVYLGHEWPSTSSVYNTVQATFGQTELGELGVDDLAPDYDHNTFNVIQASREGGELVELEDTTASGLRGRRVLDDFVGVMLTEDNHVDSLASSLLAMFKDPARTVPQISVSAFDDARLTKILSLDVGHLVRVNWSGETGARNGHEASIIRKEKSLDARERILRCVYSLGRGFDATDGYWRAGIHGRSEAGSTTKAA